MPYSGVKEKIKINKNYIQLSLDERRTIYKLLEAKTSKTEIAQVLGRHRSTIFREIRRNSFHLAEDQRCNGYFHVNAQGFARRRRAKSILNTHTASNLIWIEIHGESVKKTV